MVLFLFGAYRSLGGASPKAADSAVLLRSLHQQLLVSLAALTPEIAVRGQLGRPSGKSGDGRKVSATVQNTLDRLPPPDPLDDGDVGVRTLLAAAAEDAAWAWRMLEAPVFSPALAAAAAVLADHATECCEQAGALLPAQFLGEPGDGA